MPRADTTTLPFAYEILVMWLPTGVQAGTGLHGMHSTSGDPCDGFFSWDFFTVTCDGCGVTCVCTVFLRYVQAGTECDRFPFTRFANEDAEVVSMWVTVDNVRMSSARRWCYWAGQLSWPKMFALALLISLTGRGAEEHIVQKSWRLFHEKIQCPSSSRQT